MLYMLTVKSQSPLNSINVIVGKIESSLLLENKGEEEGQPSRGNHSQSTNNKFAYNTPGKMVFFCAFEPERSYLYIDNYFTSVS